MGIHIYSLKNIYGFFLCTRHSFRSWGEAVNREPGLALRGLHSGGAETRVKELLRMGSEKGRIGAKQVRCQCTEKEGKNIPE